MRLRSPLRAYLDIIVTESTLPLQPINFRTKSKPKKKASSRPTTIDFHRYIFSGPDKVAEGLGRNLGGKWEVKITNEKGLYHITATRTGE